MGSYPAGQGSQENTATPGLLQKAAIRYVGWRKSWRYIFLFPIELALGYLMLMVLTAPAWIHDWLSPDNKLSNSGGLWLCAAVWIPIFMIFDKKFRRDMTEQMVGLLGIALWIGFLILFIWMGVRIFSSSIAIAVLLGAALIAWVIWKK